MMNMDVLAFVMSMSGLYISKVLPQIKSIRGHLLPDNPSVMTPRSCDQLYFIISMIA